MAAIMEAVDARSENGWGGAARIDAGHVESLALRMVAWPSVGGTPGEAEFAGRLQELLLEIPYFRENPDDLRIVDGYGDPKARNVAALVRGRGRRTIVLAGHYDTVAVDNYGSLRDLACEGFALRDALVAELSGRERTEQEEQALADLLGGDFLPGRGMLDMKSGLAVAVACLERFAADPDRHGNILFVATPDEERESRGMRAMRDALPSLAASLGIEIAGAINLDVTSDQGDGADGRAAYAGTIGKLLPFAMMVGCGSHASYPFEGISAQAMAAGVLARLEGNADLADRDHTDVSPPPICLEAKDLREGYEVTTPERFWLAFNWLYHAMTAEDLFRRFADEVRAGTTDAVTRFAAQSEAHSRRTGRKAGAVQPAPRVLTVGELRARAADIVGADFEALYADEERRHAQVDNPLVASRLLTDWLVGLARIVGPAAVVGFAGLHYPPSRLLDTDDDRSLREAIDGVRAELAAEPDRAVVWKPFFQGISDMSFLGQAAAGRDVVSANTPISRLVDHPPADALRFPVVNIGPWGREFHQRLERVHVPYAFGVLPEAVYRIARIVLDRP
ncbi:M20/M25/M40 family metallo-hydrolase [Antarcticirhabdus aurantiaca]|uniref:M20/M25/M40 family metallo-hydrolase n=1 Tax=Antarcticirhabdus aurantiaca TaxID=2606717 RepID=A0ACD4NNZ2_9HYPH|nr:M20/M25/M40 family metallo-hydrolase [Antarcticirhabdus aurantiaca]WAJ28483.1 M20/M25/M40 family metallo-hydrolase [Jeongeuplla avenae]